MRKRRKRSFSGPMFAIALLAGATAAYSQTPGGGGDGSKLRPYALLIRPGRS